MKSLVTHALGVALAATLALAPGEAHANGRFPQTNALFFAPGDPSFVLLRTTFGELVSRDQGKTFAWVCEQSVGLAGVEDPMYAIMPDGTILGSTFQGLTISKDMGCNFAFVGGDLERVFIDVATTRRAPGSMVALASMYASTDGGTTVYDSRLFETTDQGKTFTALPYVFAGNVLGETVDVTESDPDRIYASVIVAGADGNFGKSSILTSHDHGKTFDEHPFPLVASETAAFIAAVDPKNADRLYVRTSAPAGMATRVLVSDDAGMTFRRIDPESVTDATSGFALSDDGSRVWIGGTTAKLLTASTTDFAFTRVADLEVGCLKWTAQGLWACSTERSGFILGVSTDQGKTFTSRLHFCDITGPLACPAGSSTYQQCSLGVSNKNVPPWPIQRASLGCEDTPDAGGADAGGAVDGGIPPASGDGGGDDDGGCAIRAPGDGVRGPAVAMGIATLAVAALVRRRRRGR